MKCFNCTRAATSSLRSPEDTWGTWTRFYCTRHALDRAKSLEAEEAEAAKKSIDRSRGSPREHDIY